MKKNKKNTEQKSTTVIVESSQQTSNAVGRHGVNMEHETNKTKKIYLPIACKGQSWRLVLDSHRWDMGEKGVAESDR